MLCGGFYLILGFPFTSEMRMFLHHFFLAPEGHPLALVLNPVLMRRASPCVALISSGQKQQFYRTTSNLYPTIPHSTLKVLCGKIPLKKAPHFSIFPRPHTSGKIFNIHTSTFSIGSQRSQ